jgi:hypothetical protein
MGISVFLWLRVISKFADDRFIKTCAISLGYKQDDKSVLRGLQKEVGIYYFLLTCFSLAHMPGSSESYNQYYVSAIIASNVGVFLWRVLASQYGGNSKSSYIYERSAILFAILVWPVFSLLVNVISYYLGRV